MGKSRATKVRHNFKAKILVRHQRQFFLENRLWIIDQHILRCVFFLPFLKIKIALSVFLYRIYVPVQKMLNFRKSTVINPKIWLYNNSKSYLSFSFADILFFFLSFFLPSLSLSFPLPRQVDETLLSRSSSPRMNT